MRLASLAHVDVFDVENGGWHVFSIALYAPALVAHALDLLVTVSLAFRHEWVPLLLV